jgi:uncharacterized membrane protein YhaH (DUF805 family)
MNWYLDVLKKYVQFAGRARRKEYWMFTLVNLVITFVLAFADSAMGLMQDSGYGLISGLYTLAVLLPAIAVSVRRLHDTNHSAWWLLIALIPLLGALVILYFMIKEGDAGSNPYGPNPKATPTGEPAVAV